MVAGRPSGYHRWRIAASAASPMLCDAIWAPTFCVRTSGRRGSFSFSESSLRTAQAPSRERPTWGLWLFVLCTVSGPVLRVTERKEKMLSEKRGSDEGLRGRVGVVISPTLAR